MFSTRNGYLPPRVDLQLNDIDYNLRVRIWNCVTTNVLERIPHDEKPNTTRICKLIWCEFFIYKLNNFPRDINGTLSYLSFRQELESWFFGRATPWYKVYDLIEYIWSVMARNRVATASNLLNAEFEKELCGYRIINGIITPITDTIEISSIESAITFEDQWESVSTHLTTALRHLTHRETPDYRNSVKESISSIESASVLVTGDANARIEDALKFLQERGQLHGAIRKAFSSLYGYTSDAGGIRHALIEDDHEVDFDEAKFFLVACSAFSNFLKSRRV